MPDYTRSTGSSGTMMIRDTGTIVEFWLRAGASTFNYEMPWAYVVNGTVSGWRQFRFVSGGSWQKIASFSVTYDQTVQFKLGDTNTSGLGGPTTLSVAIPRAKAPNPPSAVRVTNLKSTTWTASFTDGANNGSPIDARQIGWSTSPNGPTNTTGTSIGNSVNFVGLVRGTTYYLWARTHNAKGWSAWGPRSVATTHDIPGVPTQVTYDEVTQTPVLTRFSGTTNGGTPMREWQLSYGLDPNTPQHHVSSGGTLRVENLQPGKTYYFWARGRNDVGWGPYSVRTQITLRAGAFVKDGTTWRRAVPWIKVNGVWKLGRPWVRHAGVWKRLD